MRSYPHRICCGLILAAVSLVACNAQRPTPKAPAHSEAPSPPVVCAPVTSEAPTALQKKPGYRQVGVVVRDASGSEVRNLAKDDFIVKRGDTPLDVPFVKWEPDSPASVIIVADTSGSSQPKLSQTKEAITQIVNGLDPRDDVALFAFSGRPFLLESFTRNHSIVIEREKLFHPYGSTSLYDSLLTANSLMRKGCYAKRILVVISDGLDNTSRHSLDETVKSIASAGVSAYAIAIGTSEAPQPGSLRSVFVSPNEDSVDEETLGHLTDPGGGATFRVAEIADKDLLEAAAKTINERSRGQYVVGFIDPSKSDLPAVTLRIRNHTDYHLFGYSAPNVQPSLTAAPAS